jgi:predicted AlkP superfamily pyrophosphatase or phosphodiesterase
MNFFRRLFLALVALCELTSSPLYAQAERPKAIVLAWDGAVPAFVNEMLSRGLLPNLAKLIAGGAYADDVVAEIPSKTAVGFASLWTGALPRIHGISGNRIPRAPSAQYTILETGLGFSGAALRAEPLWNTAANAGLNVATVHTPLSGDIVSVGVHIQGYNRSFFRDGVITARNGKPQPATGWKNTPTSNAPPLEISFKIQATIFYGLMIDDPDDRAAGYDTLLLSAQRDAGKIIARLKSGLARERKEANWSEIVEVETADALANTYLRLFDLHADGSDYLLYFTAPTREGTAPREVASEIKAFAGAFIGNGASFLYGQGSFGVTIPQGGDGRAEARYLETVEFVQSYMLRCARWALARPKWDLLLAYTPYPDETEHLWRGYLDATLPGYRAPIAERIKPLLESVYKSADDFLGLVLAHRPANTVVALVSDHGMEGVNRWVAINRALQRSGLQILDAQGRIDLQKTQAYYPSVSSGYLLINSTDRKSGIVTPARRPQVVRDIQRALFELRDGDARSSQPLPMRGSSAAAWVLAEISAVMFTLNSCQATTSRPRRPQAT